MGKSHIILIISPHCFMLNVKISVEFELFVFVYDKQFRMRHKLQFFSTLYLQYRVYFLSVLALKRHRSIVRSISNYLIQTDILLSFRSVLFKRQELFLYM